MNSPWYTSEDSSLSSTAPQPAGEPNTKSWTKQWWPGVLAVVAVIVGVAVIAVVLPRNRGTADTVIREKPDKQGTVASVPVGDNSTGERVVKGDEAPVGGGRDTRLIAGHVTVIVPDDSVAGEGTLHVGTETSAQEPEGLSAVADAVEVALEGTSQIGAFTIEAVLPPRVGSRSFQATSTDSRGCCVVQPGRWDQERGVLVSEVPTVGLESFFTLPMGELENFAEGLIADRFSPRLASIGEPECAHEPDPRTSRLELSSGGDDSIRWCLEQLDSGGIELRIRNPNTHAVMVAFPAGIPPLRLGIPYPLTSLLTRSNEALAPLGARMVVLQHGDMARIDLSSTAEGFDAQLTTSSNVLAWTGDLFDIALDVVLGAYAKLPGWAKPSGSSLLEDRSRALESIDGMTCIKDLASGEELLSTDRGVWSELSGRLASCLGDWVTDQVPGGWSGRAMRDVAGVSASALETLVGSDSLAPQSLEHHTVIKRFAPQPEATVERPAPTTAPRTPRAPAVECPQLVSGTWRGRWTSDRTGSGNLTATIRTTRADLSGAITVSGSAHIPGGELTGRVSCEQVTFGSIDRQVEFTGEMDSGGTSMTGSYRSFRSGAVVDSGTFDAHAG